MRFLFRSFPLRTSLSWLILPIFLGLGVACGGKGAPPAEAPGGTVDGAPFAPASPTAEAAANAPSPPPPAGSPLGGSGSGAPPSSRAAPEAGKQSADAAGPQRSESAERPGLATHWGETRSSSSTSTTFDRAEFSTPLTTLVLWYNDRAGAHAMAQRDGYRGIENVAASLPAYPGISFTLQDESGIPLPGYTVGGRTYAVGEAGSRYLIVVNNRTPARLEALLSVDGLDVIDGRPANYGKRGYVMAPYGSITVDGFRQSESTVAAFRFGSVRGSYAARKGDDRNVGVIGLAVFHERGTPRWPWDQNEIERRRSAEPFSGGRFAAPPP